jgi:hypothetical protein
MRHQGGLDNFVALEADLAAKVSAVCAEDTVAWITWSFSFLTPARRYYDEAKPAYGTR